MNSCLGKARLRFLAVPLNKLVQREVVNPSRNRRRYALKNESFELFPIAYPCDGYLMHDRFRI